MVVQITYLILINGNILKNFTYSSCSIINISINTHEIHKCPRGEIGRHKGLKSQGIHRRVSPW